MSDINIADQRAHVVAQARQFLSEHEASWDAEAEATYQKYMDEIRDLREADEFRSGGVSVEDAARIVAGAGRSSASSPELRALVTPGSSTTEMWLRPTRDEVMTRASEFRVTPYLTTTGNVPGGDHFFTPELYREVVTGLVAASGVLEANPTLTGLPELIGICAPPPRRFPCSERFRRSQKAKRCRHTIP